MLALTGWYYHWYGSGNSNRRATFALSFPRISTQRRAPVATVVRDNLHWTTVMSSPAKRLPHDPSSTDTQLRPDFVRVIPTTRANVHRVEEERVNPSCVLSSVDCASGITLSEDNRTASSKLGYRSVRATKGAWKPGCHYYEVEVTRLRGSGACRLGIATSWSDLEGPVGIDVHGYAVCSLSGDGVHDSVHVPMGTPIFEGDVVGVRLVLGGENTPQSRVREAVVWDKKVFWTEEPAPEPRPVRGSCVEFFINGVRHGRKDNLLEGTYFPSVSLFTAPGDPAAEVRCRFDPDFHHRQARSSSPWTEP